MTGSRRIGGLTLIEVVLAMAVIGVVTAAFTTVAVSSMHHTTVAGARTEAVQVLNYFGRRVAGGDNTLLPASGTPDTWDYGALSAAFPDLQDQGGLSNPDLYKASITNAGAVSYAGASGTEYDVKVCFKAADAEHCVTGATVGPAPSGQTTPATLPGIN